MYFEKVALVGVGLIGGSFGLALKEARRCGRVAGAGRGEANLKDALARGAIDEIAADAAAAARGADLVLVAAPVAQFETIFLAIAPQLKPECLVMDAGSTKRDVVAAARRTLGARLAQFVPAHPIAGAEKSGAAAASAGLFRGKRVVLTPLAENPEAMREKAAAAWGACGARVSRMAPEEHDAVFAAVSHLPHLLAYALVSEVSARANAAQLFGYAAGGFRDFTRIASSHPEMWRDICVANNDELLQELGRYGAGLEKIRRMLETKDAAALDRLFADARAARERWLAGEYE
jgi:prephenate dehydrogenase